MSFLDRLLPVSFLDSLRPWFFLIALAFGLALIAILSPLDDHDGWGLIIYGAIIGAWNQQLNPTVTTQDVGPPIPWDEMHAGERLGYFLSAMSATALGVLILTVSAFSSGGLVENWMGLLMGLVVIAVGLGIGYLNWVHRHGAVETD